MTMVTMMVMITVGMMSRVKRCLRRCLGGIEILSTNKSSFSHCVHHFNLQNTHTHTHTHTYTHSTLRIRFP